MEPYQVLNGEHRIEHGRPNASVLHPRFCVLRSIGRLLQSPYLPVILGLAAIVVSLPTLTAGLLNDDFMHRSILAGPPAAEDCLFANGLIPKESGRLGYALSHTFVAVHPEENLPSLKAYGALPWWTYDGFRVAFWRPVASFTQWLDYRLFPQAPAMMHLHSILWFAAAVAGVAVLYRRIAFLEQATTSESSPVVGPAWIAALAALMYLLDDDAYFPSLWIANRNLLISLAFGAATLLAYDSWRRRQWRPGAVIAPACLLVSVLATEGGIATFAYLFAYEAALGRGRAVRRGLALVPSIAVIILWRLVYNLQGYGASGGGFYFDPVREPLDYAAAVLVRGPFFLAGQWTGVPADLYSFLPPVSKAAMWALMAALTILIPILLTPMLRANRRARFWLIGMYASAVPVCATVPMSRAMLFMAVGAFGVIAEYVGGWLAKERWRPTQGWTRHIPGTLFVVLFAAHLPLAAAGRLGAPGVTATLREKLAETLDLSPAGTLENADLVVVNAPNPDFPLVRPVSEGLRRTVAAPRDPHAGSRFQHHGADAHRPATADRSIRIGQPAGLSAWQTHGLRVLLPLSGDVRGPRHPLLAGRAHLVAADGGGGPGRGRNGDFPWRRPSSSMCPWRMRR